MATWSDIESNLNRLEELGEATLEEFAKVMPPLSHNPNFDRRFGEAKARIFRQLDKFASQRSSQKDHDHGRDDKWYKKPVGIVTLSVGAGLLIALIKYVFGI